MNYLFACFHTVSVFYYRHAFQHAVLWFVLSYSHFDGH